MITSDLAWKDEAACKGMDTNLFFPKPTKGRTSGPKQTAAARAVCRSCPVRIECVLHQITMVAIEEDHGIWGGTTPRERRALRKMPLEEWIQMTYHS